MRRLVEDGAGAIQCAPDLIGIPLLVAAGAAIGNSHTLRLKTGWEERAALYAASIALPGQAKTPALELATEPVHKQQMRLRQKFKKEKKEYQKELASLKKDDPYPKEPKLERVVVADITVEALGQILSDNSKGVLLKRDELSAFAQSLNAYKGGKGADRQFFLSLWSGSQTQIDRKNMEEPLILDSPLLAITGTIQPDCMRALLHEENWDDGFLDRFLFAIPDSRPAGKWTEKIVEQDTRESVEKIFRRLYDLKMEKGQPVVIDFDKEAKALWIDWYDFTQKESEEIPDALRGVWSKMTGHCGRLILISHLCRWAADEVDDPCIVDKTSVVRGTLLAEYFKSHARRVMEVLSEDAKEKTLRKIVDWIKRRENPGVRPRDLLGAKLHGAKKSVDAQALLDALCERGDGEWRKISPGLSGQKKADRFFLK